MALYDSQSSSNSLQFDPALMARYGQVFDRGWGIANMPFQPYTQPRVAPNTPAMTAGAESIWNWASDPTAANTLEGAAAGARAIGDYRPPSISAPTISAASLAAPGTLSARSVTPGALAGMDLSKYMNPFTQGVIDTTLSDLERSRLVQRKNDQQSATLSDSFGGSRHGVADSLTNARSKEIEAKTVAGLRSDGYDRAVSAATGDLGRRYDADVFNATNQMGADKYNIDNLFNTNKLNADYRTNADRFNAENSFTASRENANNDITGAGLRLRGAGLVGDIAGAQDNMGRTRAQAVYGVGKDDQKLTQDSYDAAYAEFERMLRYPGETQDILNSTLNGFPRNTTSSSSSNVNPGIGSQIQSWGSLIGGAAGLADRFGLFDLGNGADAWASTGGWNDLIDSFNIGDPSNFDWNASWFDAPDLGFF